VRKDAHYPQKLEQGSAGPISGSEGVTRTTFGTGQASTSCSAERDRRLRRQAAPAPGVRLGAAGAASAKASPGGDMNGFARFYWRSSVAAPAREPRELPGGSGEVAGEFSATPESRCHYAFTSNTLQPWFRGPSVSGLVDTRVRPVERAGLPSPGLRPPIGA